MLNDPAHFFDPTLQQIAEPLGAEPFAFDSPISSVSASQWDFQAGGLDLRYYHVPEDATWREAYEQCRSDCAGPARDIAEIVRSGQEGMLVIT